MMSGRALTGLHLTGLHLTGLQLNRTVAQLTTRGLLGRRRAALLAVLPVVLIGLAQLVSTLQPQDDSVTADLLGGFALATLLPMLGVIAGTGAIGPEIDDGSILYLLSKPLSRFSIATTKAVVAVGVITVFGALPVALAGLILSGRSADLALAYGVGAAVAGVGYGTLFLLLAVLTRHAVVAGLLYALIWETLVGTFVPGAQTLSVQQWALAVTETIVGPAARGLGVTSAVSLTTGVVLLSVLVVGSTWAAGHRLRSLRLAGDE
jgi:ABC-2 type transport system permease protein